MDIDKRGLVNQYCQQIVDIYCKLKDQGEAIIEAKQWLYEYSLGDLEAFLVLKSLYKEKWLKHQQEVINELENINMLDIYQEEKMYDFLLAKMIDDIMPYRMKKYEEVLKPIYPKELLEFFSKHIQIALIDSNSRKYYQGIVGQMNSLLTYPNGEKEVIALVEIIKNKYKNRPTLLDELRRVKLKR